MTTRIETLNRTVRRTTALIILGYLFLGTYIAMPERIIDGSKHLSSGGAVQLLPWFLSVAAAFISYFLVNDLHNFLDRRLFGERAKVDDLIREGVTVPCRDSLCSRAVKQGVLKEEKASLMSLFYNFIPADDTERERAFAYFTEYWIFVNASFLSILAAICISTLAVFVSFGRLDQIGLAVTTILALPLILNAQRIRVKNKLKAPAQAQISRILSQARSDLEKQLPKYRIDCLSPCPLKQKVSKNAG